ncbi:dihydrofolate reductase family protein [Paraflavitalea sp. CAU 1676]|uniref:dihydrofolate reductase family protein n=1 Tax=Paraflavitalea sp. CAU 1676 TaxID=3032598 RepID=UPI0023D9E69E|nr:dihydrofolate reductase family protein [Paraflavitalea sp. CAU 1676]MDF2187887.1 dihydrofolate reductase family protein [Paraflavitalea sp. CAU 1676]
MRKLKLQVTMTLDGFVGGPNGELDWMTCPWTDDINQYVGGIVKDVDTILLGRKLAEGFIPYWADVAKEPEHPEYDGGRIFTDTPKVVFSTTIQESPWANTVIASGDLVEEVNQLKKQPGKDIYTCGGAQFVSGLVAHNLIDEYFLLVNPAVIGQGLTIFASVGGRQVLRLVEAVPFECGIVAMHYRPQ